LIKENVRAAEKMAWMQLKLGSILQLGQQWDNGGTD